jgi:hypothetical protein
MLFYIKIPVSLSLPYPAEVNSWPDQALSPAVFSAFWHFSGNLYVVLKPKF